MKLQQDKKMTVLCTDSTLDPVYLTGKPSGKKYLLMMQKGDAWPKVTGLQNWSRAQTSPRGFPPHRKREEGGFGSLESRRL